MTLMGRKPFFFVAIAVLFTTLFSWFNLNSYCIILLLVCRLWEGGPTAGLRAAFTNKLFLAYLVFSLIETAGLLHAHDMKAGTNAVAKDATLVAVAFALCAGPFATEKEYRRLITAYSLLVFAASAWCLLLAFRLYIQQKDADVFFYHPLTRPISQNAVFYSVYVLFALLLLLSEQGDLEISFLSPGLKKGLRIFLAGFFLVMIILLSSKLVLALALLILISFFFKKYSFRKNRRVILIAGLSVLVLISGLFLTNNRIKTRYADLVRSNLTSISAEKFTPLTDFTALQLRLLEWRFALEILNEQHAWLFGVSPGDSQDLLDQKYIAANMYIGDPAEGPHRKNRGFIGYNFHNQFIETLVRSGVIGLASLIVIFCLFIGRARKWKTREAFFTILTIFLFFIPQAPLTMQHGIFLFCFFPLFLLYSPSNAGKAGQPVYS